MDFYHSGNIPVDLAERSFAAGLALRTPGGTAPLFALSGLAKRKTAKSIEHGYWSKQYDYPSFTLPNTVDIAAGDTTIQLGNTSNWQTPNLPANAGNDWQGRPLPARGALADTKRLIPGMVVRYLAPAVGGAVWTPPELLMIETVDVANNRITVTRGFAGTTAAAIPKGSTLLVVGNAYEEGSDRPQSQAVTPDRHVNFTQIFRNAWDVSGTLSSIALTQGVDAMSDNKKDCIHMHARDIETAAWFGRKYMGTRKGKPFHTMDGIEALIERYAPTNLQWAKATTSYDDLVKMVNPLLNWQSGASGGSHRVIHAGGEAFQVLQDIGRKSGNYQLVDGQTNFGLSFKRFTTGRGTFDMVENPLFNTNPQWSKMAAILDLSQFDFAYLEGRDTRHDQYNQLGNLTDGKDATGGVLTSELTIEMQAPFTCGIIYNLQAAA